MKKPCVYILAGRRSGYAPLAMLLAGLALAAACARPPSSSSSPPSSTASPPQEITRERAIEIARQHVGFQPDSIDAEQATFNSRPVWRVTFRRRLPGQPPGLFEMMIVEIDRRTSEVISIART